MFIHEIIGIFKEKNQTLLVLESGKKIIIPILPVQFIKSFKNHLLFPSYHLHYKLPFQFFYTWLQPTYSIQNQDCEFINLFKVLKIVQKDQGCLLFFQNYTRFIPLSSKRMYQSLKKNVSYKLRISFHLDLI